MRTLALGVALLLSGVAVLAGGLLWWAGLLILIGGASLSSLGIARQRGSINALQEQSKQERLRAEHLRTELSQRAAERDQLQQALASTGDLVLALDHEARIRYLNPAAQLSLRAGDLEPLSAPVLEVVQDPDLYRAVRRAIDDQLPAVLVVQRSERRFRSVVAPVSVESGSGPWSVVLAMHDLTDLYEAEIARRDFFINASHELRTPLASISAAAETLELVSRLEDAQRFRSMIQSEAGRMGQLVEEMLALARLESGLTEPQMQVVELEPLIEQALESIRPQAERAGLTLGGQLADQPLNGHGETRLMADPELVERALINLLHNAVKFTPSGGNVDVLAARGSDADPAPMIWIQVRDTGIGIEPAEQSRIFQRFYRIDRARNSQHNGGSTGLGLAVVKHIAEVHGGAVSLDSALGDGSTFGFSVPLAQQSDDHSIARAANDNPLLTSR